MKVDEGLRIFLSHRHDDTGWAAKYLAEALRQRIDPDWVFLDSLSIQPGQTFGKVIEDAVRGSNITAVLIGPDWDRPPMRGRLDDDTDWVRREILLAQETGAHIVPVLCDRDTLPSEAALPAPLQFLRELQCATIRRDVPGDAERVADLLAKRIHHQAGGAPPNLATDGVAYNSAAIEGLVRTLRPGQPAEKERLVDLALTVLVPQDRLVYLTSGRDEGHTTALLTTTDLVLVNVGADLRILDKPRRVTRSRIGPAEVTVVSGPYADLTVPVDGGESVRLAGVLVDEARHLRDLVNASPMPAAPPRAASRPTDLRLC